MKFYFVTIFILILSSNTFSQFNKTFGISVNVVYNSSASIYLSPNSSDVILRNNSFLLEDIYNPSVEFRYRLTESIILGFGTEYMTAAAVGPNLTVFLGNSLWNYLLIICYFSPPKESNF
jgi:hypothetical protein